jgi:uncharacterized protein (DUF58 family)
VTPTPRLAVAIVACALVALVVPVPLAVGAAVALLLAAAGDALSVRRPPEVDRALAAVASRGRPTRYRATVQAPRRARAVLVRQPLPAGVRLEPDEAPDGLEGVLLPVRRGRYDLEPLAVRLTGPLGLGAWTHRVGGRRELVVVPDVVAAARLVAHYRRGSLPDARRARGPLGIGTEFESIREHQPDDDVRFVNWRATARAGRPMTNTFRIERDRDVVLVLDCGRLLAAAPGREGGPRRLDLTIDAALAVAAIADEVGDRVGLVAFDEVIRRDLHPRRAGARAIAEACTELEPRLVDSAYERAFRRVAGGKRAFVLVLTDLVEPTAAWPLVDALPVIARRHQVAVASVRDPALLRPLVAEPVDRRGVSAQIVAGDLRRVGERAAAALVAAGVLVVQAPPSALGGAAVSAYLRAKERGRA